MTTRTSKAFLALSVLGVVLAFYHAWLENAFTTNPFEVQYAPFASFLGVPYWVFGVFWFPFILLVGLWATKMGRTGLSSDMLVLLTIGNIFTGYLWYLDILVVKSFTAVYVSLYVTNYALTGLVVYQHGAEEDMRGFAYGTLMGGLVGLIFGPFGVAACGIAGGIVGAMRNHVIPRKTAPPAP